MDADLKVSKHAKEQLNKANRTIGLIRRSFQIVNRESKRLLFSVLRVRIWCFGTTLGYKKNNNKQTNKNRQLIEGVLRRATKIVPGLRGLEYRERLN